MILLVFCLDLDHFLQTFKHHNLSFPIKPKISPESVVWNSKEDYLVSGKQLIMRAKSDVFEEYASLTGTVCTGIAE